MLINPSNSLGSNLAQTVQRASDTTEMVVKTKSNLVTTNAKNALATTAGLAATVAATNAVKNSSALQETITKGLKKITSSDVFKQVYDNVAPYAKKAASWVKALPAPAKIVLGAGAVITGLVVNAIQNKGIFNQGKIFQQYEDKQTVREALNNI